MKVLFDTNVLLDVLLEREPHVEVAEKLVALVDNHRIEGFICATAATTLHYVGVKVIGRKAVHKHLRTLLGVFEVAAVDRAVLQRALDANGLLIMKMLSFTKQRTRPAAALSSRAIQRAL